MNGVGPLLERALLRARPEQARVIKLRLHAQELLGADLARRCRVRLEGNRVVLELADPRWVAEVRGLEDLLLGRFSAAIGKVEGIDVREVKWTRPRVSRREQPQPEIQAPLSARFEAAAARLSEPGLAARMAEVAGRYLAAGRMRRNSR